MLFEKVNPIIDLSVRQLCRRPYGYNSKTRRYSHPKGCPNYGKKLGCPPNCRTIEQIIDLSSPIYVVWNVFDFASHCNRMKAAHPNWSQRRIECCLYWQPKARKQLKLEIVKFTNTIIGYFEYWQMLDPPEATGINVTATMKTIGEDLEWPPVTKTYQVVLCGRPLEKAKDGEF